MTFHPVPYRPARLPDDEALARAAALRQRMEARRSVRMFSPDPVPERALDGATDEDADSRQVDSLRPVDA